MNEKPFIHLFQVNKRSYCYDVNKNKIIEIPKKVYQYLLTGQIDDRNDAGEIKSYVEELKEKGFLKSNHSQVSEHSATECYKYFVDNDLGQLTLQVTRKCNLDCGYCVYSGNYDNRHHADKWMTFEIAKKAIDYYVAHSSDEEEVSLGFYGGEPLLAFDFIKECVAYAEEAFEGRKVMYSFTTNGTLLTDEKLDFLVHYNFAVLISLDGPEDVQNRHRKFANSGIGSFETMMKNIKNLKLKYPDYYRNHVSFNTVLDQRYPLADIANFVLTNEIVRESRFNCSTINDTYADTEIRSSSVFFEEYQYEKFKTFLWLTGRLKKQEISPIMLSDFSSVRKMAVLFDRYNRETLPYKGHRGGPCIPGVRKLFVAVEGEFYPCERVRENSKVPQIGDVYRGIDEEKALSILNIERISTEKCKNCWACFFCYLCVAQADDGNELSECKLCKACGECKINVEETMKDYVVLHELGYNQDLDADRLL